MCLWFVCPQTLEGEGWIPVLILCTCELTEYLKSLKGMFMVGYSGAYGRVHSRILSINDLSSLSGIYY